MDWYSCSISSQAEISSSWFKQALDAQAYGLALLLEGLDLLLHFRQLRGLLIEKLLSSVSDALLGGGAGFALFLEQLDRAQHPLFERVEVIGSKGKFGFLVQGWTSRYLFIQGEIQSFFAQYSCFCTEEN